MKYATLHAEKNPNYTIEFVITEGSLRNCATRTCNQHPLV